MARVQKAVVSVAMLLFSQWAVDGDVAGAHEVNRSTRTEDKSHKVLCSYFYFGTQRNLCGDPPLEEVKKRCDEEATKERGEKTECACTQDANYIKDACD
jgi:hypothetical protein